MITWINTDLLLPGPLETNLSEIWMETHDISLKEMDFKYI